MLIPVLFSGVVYAGAIDECYHDMDKHEPSDKTQVFCQTACNQNDALSCGYLGWLLYSRSKQGKLLSKESFEKSCRLNSSYGCESLYFFFFHTPRIFLPELFKFKLDLKQAKGYCEKACRLGRCKCLTWGYHDETDKQLYLDPEYVVNFLEKMCSINVMDACNLLGEIYYGDENKDYRHIVAKPDFQKSEYYYNKLCTNINSDSKYVDYCESHGANLYFNKKDYNLAIKYLTIACNLNDSNGCDIAGLSYLRNNDYDKAIKYYEKACKLDLARGCYMLGESFKSMHIHNFDYGLEHKYKVADYFEKACNLNSGEGCRGLASLYYFGELNKPDYDKGIKLFEKSCALEDANGCASLAYLYSDAEKWLNDSLYSRHGVGVKQDYDKAVKFYEIACNINAAYGCEELGSFYLYGNGVKKDYQKAQKYYHFSCDKGARKYESCNNLGYLYEKGVIGEINLSQAKYYYKQSCDAENKLACSNLGNLYNSEREYQQAKTYFEKACNLKHSNGCNNLGVLYNNGLGVRQNKNTAKEYYGKACDLGNQEGCDNYRKLNEQGY